MKSIVWQRRVDGGRRWLSAGGAVRGAIVAVSLASALLVAAQEPDASAQTGGPTADEVISQLGDLIQAADSTQPEDMAPPNDLTPTNGLPQAAVPAPSAERPDRGANRFDNSSRAPSDDRRSRSRRSPRSRSTPSGGSAPANDYSQRSDGTNAGPASLDYAAFKLIADRNIFDPNRLPHRPGERPVRPTPKSVDSLTLVGTMSYEKGTFAVFDGSSSEYRKTLKLTGTNTIAGYKLTNIAPNSVKLASGTNVLELSMGAQLRREENGPWLLAGQGGTYADTPAATSASTAAPATAAAAEAAPSGPDSDILKKLMERRAKE